MPKGGERAPARVITSDARPQVRTNLWWRRARVAIAVLAIAGSACRGAADSSCGWRYYLERDEGSKFGWWRLDYEGRELRPVGNGAIWTRFGVLRFCGRDDQFEYGGWVRFGTQTSSDFVETGPALDQETISRGFYEVSKDEKRPGTPCDWVFVVTPTRVGWAAPEILFQDADRLRRQLGKPDDHHSNTTAP